MKGERSIECIECFLSLFHYCTLKVNGGNAAQPIKPNAKEPITSEEEEKKKEEEEEEPPLASSKSMPLASFTY